MHGPMNIKSISTFGDTAREVIHATATQRTYCIHLCKEKQRNENLYNVQKSRSYSLNTTNLHIQQTNSGHQFEAHFQCWRPISGRVERCRSILKFGTFCKCDLLDLHIYLTSNSVSKGTNLLWQTETHLCKPTHTDQSPTFLVLGHFKYMRCRKMFQRQVADPTHTHARTHTHISVCTVGYPTNYCVII